MHRDRSSSLGAHARRAALVATFVALGTGCSRKPADTSATAASTAPLAEMSVDDVANRLARHETLVVYDVNSREHYGLGHVPGARWAKFNEITASILPADRATPLVFYCASET